MGDPWRETSGGGPLVKPLGGYWWEACGGVLWLWACGRRHLVGPLVRPLSRRLVGGLWWGPLVGTSSGRPLVGSLWWGASGGGLLEAFGRGLWKASVVRPLVGSRERGPLL